MFLAINELVKEKSRFILIVAVIALVSYLTFFLTALAYGLATSYTQGVDKWQADGIVLDSDANSNVARSLMTSSDYAQLIGEDTALLGVGSATIEVDEKDDITLFGVETDKFLYPTITEGRKPNISSEIIASDELKSIGVELGSELKLTGGETAYSVVAFTDRATFQTAPIVYMDLATWREAVSEVSGMIGMRDDSTISAVVTRNYQGDSAKMEGLEWYKIQDFIFSLPGYQAQVLTFGTMIGFLIAISSFVLAIFMYILTLQKKSIFGVLKAEGIPNKYISSSVKLQIAILSVIGMGFGLVATTATGLALAGKVPFMVQPLFFVGIIALFLLTAAIGGIASVRAVTKIDPVEAIG